MLLFAPLLVSPVSSQEPPRVQQFLIAPKDRIVSAGASLTLKCVIDNIGGQCSWERDGIPVGLYPDKYHMEAAAFEAGDCSLTILEASPEWDEGEWRCQVSAGDIARADSLISAPARLTVTQPPTEVSLVTTEDRGSRCVTLASNPPAEMKILLDNEVISLEDVKQENVRLDTGGWRSSLNLASVMVRTNHRRTLRCVAQHGETNTSLVTSTVLDVTFPPFIISTTFETAADRKQNYYMPGDTAVLQCEVEGNPAASIRWRHVDTGQRTPASVRGRAVIEITEKDTRGQYECVAENELGASVSEPLTLRVAHVPRVVSGDGGDKTLNVNVGENLTLLCKASAIPEPDYRWMLKDPSGDIIIVAEEALLTIDSVGYQHGGELLCEASNVMGTRLGDVYRVSVEGRPVIQNPPTGNNFTIISGDMFSFIVEVCSHPKPSVTWLKDSQEIHSHSLERVRDKCYLSSLQLANLDHHDAGQYRVTVSNLLGEDSVTMQLRVAASELSEDLIIGAGAGVTIILFVILAPAVIIVIHRQRRNNAKTIQSSGSNTKNCSDIENPSQHGSKEELIVNKGLAKLALTSEAADPVIVRNLYSQLGFPKSSNCGSMRRKKESHYNDMIKVYNATITRNLILNQGSFESPTSKISL